MNWFSSGRVDSFRFVRVRWGTWTETEELEGIIGGTLERNDSTAIKASGSLDYILEPALGSDLVRVYSDSYYPPTGERTSIAQGTYLASTPSSTYRGAIEEGTADLYGVLHSGLDIRVYCCHFRTSRLGQNAIADPGEAQFILLKRCKLFFVVRSV